MAQRILFARIGWMKYYNGSQPGDERPIDGGSWNDDEIGSELCNFKSIHTGAGDPILYGFVITPGGNEDGIRPRLSYKKAGFEVHDRHATKPYDFLCVKGTKQRYVEVKGTAKSGEKILITSGEIEWVREADGPVDLCVVHSITVTKGKKPNATAGKLVRYTSWDPNQHELRAVSFICKLAKSFIARTRAGFPG